MEEIAVKNCECTTCTCKKRIALIDADSIPYAFAWKFKDKDPTNEFDLKDMYTALRSNLENTLDGTNCTHYIGLLAGGKCFRHGCHAEYKANRGEKADFYVQWEKVIKDFLVDELNFYKLADDCYIEVDDAVGILNTYLKKNWSPVIVAIDKDMSQLKGEFYNPVTRENFTVTNLGGLTREKVKKKTKIKAYGDYLVALQMLTGDGVDNIRGLRGVGGVRAYDTIKDCESTSDLFRAVCRKYKKEVKEGDWRDLYRTTYNLIKILDTVESGKKHGFNIKSVKPIEREISVQDIIENEFEGIEVSFSFDSKTAVDFSLHL